ncbi:hypothetical protein PMAYCL1PPCAC_15091 [Pristionchus mayeri]|uniref:Homeobox domain-containing protein n=1 Tax=Pristionchus mayeri TaxID=1317129 RepID=A0AAN5HY81_9BILA|nr:hypothetical protein PMAYCL1PPCAC_15091 [Pristionchus mayeri]
MQADDNYMIRVMHVKSASGESRTLQFPVRLDLDRPKRARTTFSEQQLAALDHHYRRDGYVTGEKRAKLAESLGLTDTQVKVWFQNRRTKDRKKKGSEDEEPAKRHKTRRGSPCTFSSVSSSSSSSPTSSSSTASTDVVPSMLPAATIANLPLLTQNNFLPIPVLFPFAYTHQGLLLPANFNA